MTDGRIDHMAGSIQLPDGRTLTMDQDLHDVTSYGDRPDPSWRHTDSNGHEHRAEGSRYPTLRWVVDEEDHLVNEGTDEDPEWEEYPGSGHYECVDCAEHIQPGMLGPSPWHQFVPGVRHWYLDDQPITEDEAQALIASARP